MNTAKEFKISQSEDLVMERKMKIGSLAGDDKLIGLVN